MQTLISLSTCLFIVLAGNGTFNSESTREDIYLVKVSSYNSKAGDKSPFSSSLDLIDDNLLKKSIYLN